MGAHGDRHRHQRAAGLRRSGARAPVAQSRGSTLITAPDLVEATADTGAFVQLSGVLKRCAVKLSKICNDLRLLSSGPRAGFGEINLPPMQPGSSIMPGKVNPVIPEVVNQVCFDVIGGDVTVTMAAEAGQLQLNVFEPIIAYRLLRSIEIAAQRVRRAARAVRRRDHGESGAHALVRRALDRHRHGARAGASATRRRRRSRKEALDDRRGVYELVMERKLLTREELDRALNPEAMTGSIATPPAVEVR